MPDGTSRDTTGRAPGDDWAVKAADTVEQVVGVVRERAVEPVRTVARAVVFGLLAAVVGAMALVLVIDALVRALDVYVPPSGPGHVWVAHLLTGGILTLFGTLLFAKRR